MKTGGTQVKIPENNRIKVNSGDTVRCIKSQSCAYTEGKTYEVYTNEKGWRCISGDDGLEDIWSMMVSSFTKVEGV